MTDDSVILLADAKKEQFKDNTKNLFNILKQNLIQGVYHKYKKIRAIKILIF